ncbi:MAG: nickel/cobalt efflux transporter RcnA, partial [Verrucomicrobia bacterium]|nr:nickel/cobalt efflux transporter RcnA [Verrucomicrobiota bacterium]
MLDLVQSIQSGASQFWLFIPTAVILGALHALEPGHSKTMMTAFIIAVRGTVWQAVLLGLSAAVSHSLVVWVLAAAALKAGEKWNVAVVEPYIQIGSGACIILLAVWMFLRTRRQLHHSHDHSHDHGHHHGHHHGRVQESPAAESNFQDAHEREHAEAIERHFAGRSVTTTQIVLFGITGGLMPCPAAFSVLLICIQIKRV